MSRADPSLIDRLRQPEYTGENRCLPCTVVNVAIAVAVGGLLALVAVPVGAAVFVLCLTAIYLRGYLVPGTPELTKRYLPTRAQRLFHVETAESRVGPEFVENSRGDGERHRDSDTDEGDSPTFRTLEKMRRAEENAVDPEAFLLETGVVEPDDDGGEFGTGFAFTPAFASAARERLPADVDAVGPERLAPMFRVEPDAVEPQDRAYPAYRVGVRIRKWPSAAARALDVATFEAIDEQTERWADVPMEQRQRMVEWLRGFYDACPVCDGAVEFSDDVIESCCGQFNVTTLACADCGVHLREFDPSKVGTRDDLKGITP